MWYFPFFTMATRNKGGDAIPANKFNPLSIIFIVIYGIRNTCDLSHSRPRKAGFRDPRSQV
jgi:hypothetical protein